MKNFIRTYGLGNLILAALLLAALLKALDWTAEKIAIRIMRPHYRCPLIAKGRNK